MGDRQTDHPPFPLARLVSKHTLYITHLGYVLRPASVIQSDQSSSRVPSESSPSQSGPAFLLPPPAYVVRLDRGHALPA
jgi:hypothetical protein